MKSFIGSCLLALMTTGQVWAEDITFGAVEYANSCAQCHGMDGKGGGPMASYLSGSLPDLTQLQASNGGVFPVMDLYNIIDGSTAMGPHGTREMPAWGNRYNADAEAQMSLDLAVGRETYIRMRILALIEHLATLQE